MSRPSTTTLQPEDDALAPKVSTSCLDFLLIELVPLAQRITDQIHARDQALLETYQKSKIFHPPQETPSLPTNDSDRSNPSATTTTTSTSPATAPPEALTHRLLTLGHRVGQSLAHRPAQTTPRPTTPLEAIKFICKDLWPLLWRKQIDNLKTNHRGIFVLTDARFQPIARMSVDRRGGAHAAEEALARAQVYLCWTCGVIRGALQALGVEGAVTAETSEIPAATFQIKTKGAKT